MLHNGQIHTKRTHRDTSMCYYYDAKCHEKRIKSQPACFNLYCVLVVTCLSIQIANSNTTNMRNFSDKSDSKFGSHSDKQNDSPSEDNYEDHDNTDYTKVNFENNPYYHSEDVLHLNSKFYSGENNAYSNYEDYKKFYLSPDPIPKSSVKFKISSRIVQTKYGKLQGIILAMDEHRYLSPLEVFLGVPYATPPVGSNR